MQISKTRLKEQLNECLEKAELENEEIIITDNGKPICKIVKYSKAPTTEELFAPLGGKVKYYEDLTTPTLEEWGYL